MNHVMIDLETLGQRPGCAILSIGAVLFDPVKEKMGKEFYRVVSRDSCKAAGLEEDNGTLKWWDQQSVEAKQVLTDAANPAACLPLQDALTELGAFLSKHAKPMNLKVWGNGSDFDNAILAVAFARTGFGQTPWRFWNNRCFRTFKGLAPSIKPDRTGTYHNALDDAKTQVAQLFAINKHLNGLLT